MGVWPANHLSISLTTVWKASEKLQQGRKMARKWRELDSIENAVSFQSVAQSGTPDANATVYATTKLLDVKCTKLSKYD